MSEKKASGNLDDQNAVFSDFVNISYKKLHRYALSLLPPSAADAADDLVQEAYSRVLESMRRGSPLLGYFEYHKRYGTEPIDIMRYMHVVVKHVFLDMVQRNRSDPVSLDNLFEADNQSLDPRDPDEYSNVEWLVLRKESSATLNAYVKELPNRTRTVIQLKLDGFSSQEIANELSLSPSTVRVAAMRGRRLLHAMIVKGSQASPPRNQQNRTDPRSVPPAIVNAVAQLNNPYKKVVAFHILQHMGYEEIADILGRSVGTVKSQCHRGMKKLQSLAHSSSSQNNSAQERLKAVSAQLVYVHLLDRDLREIVELHYIRYLSYAQIAKKLGLSEGTVKGRMSRAMKFLQQCVDSQGVPTVARSSSRRCSDLPEDTLEYIELVHKEYRDILKKWCTDSLSISQMATEFGMSPEAVKTRIRRGKDLLKENIDRWRDLKRMELSS